MERPKILIVDDQQDVRDLLVNFISCKIDCEIKTAGDGQSALQQLRAEDFDLILMDIKMPGLSGIDLIKEAIKISPTSKIIVISAYDSQNVASEAMRVGAHDYILKSQSPREIELKLQHILSEMGKYIPRK